MDKKKENFWIPYADLMTVLMVIFLFISLAYMGLVQAQDNERKKEYEERKKIFEEYKRTYKNIYDDLYKTFQYDFRRWDLVLDKDLSIKFTNPRVLFGEGSSEIKTDFQTILDEFFPKYLSVVMKKEFRDKIAEIRIEGHTNTNPVGKSDDKYIDNMELSQNRARNVLRYLRSQNCFTQLDSSSKELLQYWLTANGLSFGRTLDSNNILTHQSKQEIDNEKSRRVEFRIVTTTDELVQKVIAQLDK